MRMPSKDYKSALLQLIAKYRLDEKYPYWRRVTLLLERGALSEPTCKALLHNAENAAQDQEDYPDHLHRLPSAEQLYVAGEPQVRLGTALEDPSLIIGVRFDRPLHIVVAGCTGFGKTTLVRILLRAVHEYNNASSKTHLDDRV
jgi:hypothetical protein